ncbi:MAG: hypothetical protein K2W95_29425 [Candidatus Obscuribacterales bacterium]|nr:hypothetical protein [Candidatus Obscuribacterales bacterium]
MTAKQLAWDAVRALSARQTARNEVVRIQYLLEEVAQDLAARLKDGEQPRYIQVMAKECTMDRTFRCGCRRCNEWTTYSRWFRSSEQGYYALRARQYNLEKELEAAIEAAREAARLEKRLASEARAAALAELDA